MSRGVLVAGLGAVAAIAVAVTFALRPSDDLIAAPSKAGQDTSEVVARLGSQQVSADELKNLLTQLPAQLRQQLQGDRVALETWLRARLAEKSLYQQAEAKDWSKQPEVQRQIQAAVEQVVVRNYLNSVTQVPEDYPSEAELEQAYDASKASLQIPATYRLSQIFLSVPDQAAADSVQKQAQALSKRAQAKEADFAELARTYSQDQGSAQRGGDIGLQPLAQLLPEIRQTVTELTVGHVSAPIKSPLGLHIIKLTEAQPARVATVDEVRNQLREALRSQRQEQAAQTYISEMFNSSTLSLEGAALNKVLESQL